MTNICLYHIIKIQKGCEEVNIKLLRSEMALKGDYDLVCLVPITGLSKQAVSQRCNHEVPWKQTEISALAKHYKWDAETVAKIFELTE